MDIYGRMLACNLHCVISLHIFFYCVICIVLVNALFCTVYRRDVNKAIKSRVK